MKTLKHSSGSQLIGFYSTGQDLQDLTVTFMLTQTGSAGVLKSVGMPQHGSGSNLEMLLCDKEN